MRFISHMYLSFTLSGPPAIPSTAKSVTRDGGKSQEDEQNRSPRPHARSCHLGWRGKAGKGSEEGTLSVGATRPACPVAGPGAGTGRRKSSHQSPLMSFQTWKLAGPVPPEPGEAQGDSAPHREGLPGVTRLRKPAERMAVRECAGMGGHRNVPRPPPARGLTG